MKNLILTLTAIIACALAVQAQKTPCDAPIPTMAEMAAVAEAVENFAPLPGTAPFTWQVPVRVTVCYKDDGTSSFGPLTEAQIDDALADMNSKMSVGTAGNTFNFHRCGRANYVHIDEFNNGSQSIHAYSYAPGYINLYFLQSLGNSFANFPWNPGEIASIAFVKSGVAGTTVQHELGHTVGLFHTHHVNGPFLVPPVPTQADWPDLATAQNGSTTGNGLRELVINDEDNNKEFPQPNNPYAGDAVPDTPPGCDDGNPTTWPAMESLSPECFDNDPATPCENYCQTGNGPCNDGCIWDYTNCKYIGNAVDYNMDPLDDQMDILIKNIMSYTGPCRQEFTPGQADRAEQMYQVYLGNWVQPELCETMDDKVEIEDTADGVDRVSVRITNQNAIRYSRCVTDPDGRFTGQLNHESLTGSITADVRLLGSNPDFTYTYDDWVKGVTALDLVFMARHVLGIEILDGYGQIAADVNKSGGVTTFDILRTRQLILGDNQTFPERDQPWAFIPEVVTIDKSTGQTHADFNGGGDDNPFDMDIVHVQGLAEHVTGAPYINNDWPYYMKATTQRQGFDAVKLGNVAGGYPGLLDPCPGGGVVMVVPDVPVATGEEFDLKVKGFNFSNVGAFQIGVAASPDDFEFVSSTGGSLPDFSEDSSVGGLNHGDVGIKLLWMGDDLLPQSKPDGSELMTLRLRAKNDIPSLQQLLYLDENVLKTLFYTPDGGCIDNVSLELAVDVVGVADRSSGPDANGHDKMEKYTQNLFCHPNPASNRTNIILDAEQGFTGLVRFFDVHGKVLKEDVAIFEKGRNILRFDGLSFLPSGIINISVLGGSKPLSTRLMKL